MVYFDENITPLLAIADNGDLSTLVEYISKASVTEELTASSEYKTYGSNFSKYHEKIADEICLFGGNSFANIIRGGHGVSYYEVVSDVADRINATYCKNDPIEIIENAILTRMAVKAWEAMDDATKKEFSDLCGFKLRDIPKAAPVMLIQGAIRLGGFASYQVAVGIANAVARQVLGHGLKLAANAALNRWIAIFAGPVGWVLMGLWVAVDIAGPAYRVTMPCVVHIAMLRRKYSIMHCPSCGAECSDGANFCSKCGANIQRKLGLR